MNGVTEHDVKQGGEAWYRLRCGALTGSRVAAVVTPEGRATKSKAREAMVAELVLERLTGEPAPHYATAAMQRGTDLEPARAWYELSEGATVRTVGYVTRAGLDWCGVSPDGLVDPDGGIEIKCLLAANHVGALIAGEYPADYRQQVQWSLWLTGRAWWDVVLYCDAPGVPSATYRVLPDAGMHAALAAAVPAFLADVAAAYERLRGMGGGVSREALSEALNPTKGW